VDELAEDSPFHAVVDDHHLVLARLRFPARDALFPAIWRLGRDLGGQVLPFHARRLARALDQRLRRRAGGVDNPLLRAGHPQDTDQPAGIDALDADQPVALEKMRERLPGAPVRRLPADPPRAEAAPLRGRRLLAAEAEARCV